MPVAVGAVDSRPGVSIHVLEHLPRLIRSLLVQLVTLKKKYYSSDTRHEIA